MKNVEIAEGGIGRRLSGTKFVLTDKPNSDQMEVWVDEDDRKLARLYATNNGTYYPEDYDAYGFSSVTVSIHGGVALPEMPKIEMPDGIEYPALIPEIEMPDGTLKPIDELFPEIAEDPLADIGEVKMPDTVGEEGSSIVGIDPEDGYTYKVDVDENGTLEVEKVPTDIRATSPDKTVYGPDEEIDTTGMKVELVDKDGNVVKTKEYPSGVAPADEVVVNNGEEHPTTPKKDDIKGTWKVKTDIDFGYDLRSCYALTAFQHRIRPYRDIWTWYSPQLDIVDFISSSGFHGYSISSSFRDSITWTETREIYDQDGNLISSTQNLHTADSKTSYTKDGKTAYAIGYTYIGTGTIQQEGLAKQGIAMNNVGPIAWQMLYGNTTLEVEQEMPVEWESIYSGEVLEDGTTIVTSSPYEETE